MEERLQKYMARCGVDTRGHCEEIIKEKRVKVNGVVIYELGCKIDPSKDEVFVDDKKISLEEEKVYYMLNKPCGYVSTVHDEKGRKTIIDLVKAPYRVYPIGRLDYDSSGLILLTNDGDVYNSVIHPRENVEKVYEVLIKGRLTPLEINKFEKGVDIGGYITKEAKLHIVEKYDDSTLTHVKIHEGKNRQIRKMYDGIGHEVISLKRISIGNINLGSLEEGTFRELNQNELKYLKNLE